MIAGPSASAAKILDKSKQLKPQPVPVAPVEAAKPAVQIASHQLPSSAGENQCNQALLMNLTPLCLLLLVAPMLLSEDHQPYTTMNVVWKLCNQL